MTIFGSRQCRSGSGVARGLLLYNEYIGTLERR